MNIHNSVLIVCHFRAMQIIITVTLLNEICEKLTISHRSSQYLARHGQVQSASKVPRSLDNYKKTASKIRVENKICRAMLSISPQTVAEGTKTRLKYQYVDIVCVESLVQ